MLEREVWDVAAGSNRSLSLEKAVLEKGLRHIAAGSSRRRSSEKDVLERVCPVDVLAMYK